MSKKQLASLLVVALSFTFLLSACNKTPEDKMAPGMEKNGAMMDDKMMTDDKMMKEEATK